MAGYGRARADWVSWPSQTTVIRRADLNQWDQAIYDLKTRGAKDPMDYGAVGDGVADDTAAWNSALADAGTGGIVLAPPGTSIVGDLVIPSEFMTIRGAGSTKSVLKAKAAATYVLDITKLRDTTISDLTIDGNAKASKGIRLRGGASATGSERNGLERVNVTNCSTGIDVVTAAVDQVDKNTFYRCFINSCTTGMAINSANAQQQLMLQSHFENCTTSVSLTSGSFEMIGGQIGQAGGTGILLNAGGTIQWVLLEDVIMEGQAIGIDGNLAWPINGVTVRQSVVNGSTNAVKMGSTAAGSVLYGLNARFGDGNILLAGADNIFYDEFCTSTLGGAAGVTISGASARHMGVGPFPFANVASANSITIPFGTKVAQITGTTQINGIVATGQTGQTITLFFNSTPTVKNNFTNIFLNGAVDFVATANDTLSLFCNGTNWYEIGRAVI